LIQQFYHILFYFFSLYFAKIFLHLPFTPYFSYPYEGNKDGIQLSVYSTLFEKKGNSNFVISLCEIPERHVGLSIFTEVKKVAFDLDTVSPSSIILQFTKVQSLKCYVTNHHCVDLSDHAKCMMAVQGSMAVQSPRGLEVKFKNRVHGNFRSNRKQPWWIELQVEKSNLVYRVG
jgi:hypothetical protein